MHPRRRHGHGPHHGGGRKLFWRVYLHGIVLLLAVVVAVGVIGFAVGRGNNSWKVANDYQRRLIEGGPALLADPARLDALARGAGDRANVDVSLYAVDGRLLATNIEPPLPPLAPQVVTTLGNDIASMGRQRWRLVMPVRQEGQLVAYAVGEWRGPGMRELLKGLSYLAGILLVLALASAPLVRTIVGPLEKLTGAVRAFGGGDLSARSGIRRKDEVGELATAFDEMAARMERLVRNERELLANVSHELRTPLSRIRVALELAAEGDAVRAQKYLGEIGSDLGELERLIEDVLTAARLDSKNGGDGAFPIHAREVASAELIEEAARRFRDAWPERSLHTELAPDLPVVHADPVLVRRVVDNLLDNARKYSEDGQRISVRARTDTGALLIEVADEGIGMSADDLKQLFTPFFRSDRSRARGTGGVGLGLALARRIVEAHGGTLSASSEPGRGSVFVVRIPTAPRSG